MKKILDFGQQDLDEWWAFSDSRLDAQARMLEQERRKATKKKMSAEEWEEYCRDEKAEKREIELERANRKKSMADGYLTDKSKPIEDMTADEWRDYCTEKENRLEEEHTESAERKTRKADRSGIPRTQYRCMPKFTW